MQMPAANRLSCPFLPRSGDLGRGTNWGSPGQQSKTTVQTLSSISRWPQRGKNSIRKGLTRTLTHRERVGKIACDSTHPPEQRFKPIR